MAITVGSPLSLVSTNDLCRSLGPRWLIEPRLPTRTGDLRHATAVGGWSWRGWDLGLRDRQVLVFLDIDTALLAPGRQPHITRIELVNPEAFGALVKHDRYQPAEYELFPKV
jgi:hypothetical protein